MRNEPMRRNELPETCFSILPSSGQLIIIRCGERGYYPSEWDTGNREENREIASSHNVRRGITDIQEAAMLAGSMFGWNTPGANPQWYLDNARYVNSNIVQGHIKDPIMSVYYPVSSFLLRYEIMGKQHFYLPMDKLPQELMSQRSQFIMLPDLVRGVPSTGIRWSRPSRGMSVSAWFRPCTAPDATPWKATGRARPTCLPPEPSGPVPYVLKDCGRIHCRAIA